MSHVGLQCVTIMTFWYWCAFNTILLGRLFLRNIR